MSIEVGDGDRADYDASPGFAFTATSCPTWSPCLTRNALPHDILADSPTTVKLLGAEPVLRYHGPSAQTHVDPVVEAQAVRVTWDSVFLLI